MSTKIGTQTARQRLVSSPRRLVLKDTRYPTSRASYVGTVSLSSDGRVRREPRSIGLGLKCFTASLVILLVIATEAIKTQNLTLESELVRIRSVMALRTNPFKPEAYIEATVYGYSSTVDQTDADPYTTASGERVRKGIVANNCLPFGTKVAIAKEMYEVKDRMNSRYGCNVFDIWFPTRSEAVAWGKKLITITHDAIPDK